MTHTSVQLSLVDPAMTAARKRYSQFLQDSVAAQKVWGLKDNQGFVQYGSEGQVCLPVWADEEEAYACASDEWDGCEPAEIPMKLWVGGWLTNMAKKNAMLVISPDDEEGCVVIGPMDIQQDTLSSMSAANC